MATTKTNNRTKGSNLPAVQAKTKAPVTSKVEIDPDDPIPFEHTGRAFSFINNTQYIPFLGGDDNFAQKLLEARMLSITGNRCIITKRDYCAGSGFHDAEGKEVDKEIMDWLKSLNIKNESAREICRQIFDSHFTWGNTPIELVRMTVGRKKVFFVYVHSFLEWRLGVPDENDIVTYAVSSKLFVRGAYVSAEMLKNAKKLPLYNPRNREKKNWYTDSAGVERTMIWYKNSVAGFPHYGLPENVASLITEVLEYKGQRFNLDMFENNMVVDALLALKGNISQPEANKIGKTIIKAHTGDGKRGRVVVVASEEGIDGSDFHNMDTYKEGSYVDSDNAWVNKIILANGWDAVLAGIVSSTTLGKGSGFLTKIHEIKQITVIDPAQEDMIDKVWSIIFNIAQDWLGLGFDQYTWDIQNSIDISGLTDVDITPAVQVNEVRKAKGLTEDPKMNGVYLGQLSANQKKGKKKGKKEDDPDVSA